jgi:hypothetical protein
VLAGTINLWGAVEVSVLKPAAESSLQKIIKLIRDAQHQKAPSQQFTDKFSTYYTYGALAIVGGDVFRMVARLWIDAVHFGGRDEERVLSDDDVARRGVAVRAGVVHSVGGAGGDCLGRAAWGVDPGRRGGGETCGRERGGLGQDWAR